MRPTMLARLLALALLALLLQTGLAQQKEKEDDDNEPSKTFIPKSVQADPNKKPAFDALPFSGLWDTKELMKIGRPVETRNELSTKNRVVWTFEVKEAPKTLPALQVAFMDSERGRLYTEKNLEYKTMKDDKGKIKFVVVTLPLPAKDVQKNTYIVVFEKKPEE
jgi:hypothetical protein